jgi:putative tricarboxylic transport membrane protein
MKMRYWQTGVGVGVLALAGIYAYGASTFPAETGYAGIGPRFFPGVVAALLALVGGLLLWQALSGGFRNFDDSEAGNHPALRGGLWVSAGIIANALLITKVGFVVAAMLLFVCVARGFGSTRPLRDAAYGALITLPVFWLFTKVLGVTLPKLINSWL